MSQKITKFTKQNLRSGSELDRAITEALNKVAAEFGLSARLGGGKFTDTEFTGKVIFSVADPEIALAAEKASFAMWCKLYGLEPEHYGIALPPYHGVAVTLVGFNPKKPKYALKGRTADGRTVNYAESVVFHLKRSNETWKKPQAAGVVA